MTRIWQWRSIISKKGNDAFFYKLDYLIWIRGYPGRLANSVFPQKMIPRPPSIAVGCLYIHRGKSLYRNPRQLPRRWLASVERKQNPVLGTSPSSSLIRHSMGPARVVRSAQCCHSVPCQSEKSATSMASAQTCRQLGSSCPMQLLRLLRTLEMTVRKPATSTVYGLRSVAISFQRPPLTTAFVI